MESATRGYQVTKVLLYCFIKKDVLQFVVIVVMSNLLYYVINIVDNFNPKDKSEGHKFEFQSAYIFCYSLPTNSFSE